MDRRGPPEGVEETFHAFCKGKPDMDGNTFAKLFKDCKLISKCFTGRDVDILFASVTPKGERRMDFLHFCNALAIRAEKRDLDLDHIYDAVSAGLPDQKTTQTGSYVRLHDDKTTYTGMYAYTAPKHHLAVPEARTSGGSRNTSGSPAAPVARPTLSGDCADTLVRRRLPPSPSPRAETRDVADTFSRRRSVSPRSETRDAAGARRSQNRSGSPDSVPHRRSSSDDLTDSSGPRRVPSSPRTESRDLGDARCFQPPPRQLTRASNGAIEETFKAYCENRPDMDGKNFVKVFRDCNLIDKVISANELDIIFAKLTNEHKKRRINLAMFERGIWLVANARGVDEKMVRQEIAGRAPNWENAAKPDAVRLHDDKSLYTGVYRCGGPEVWNGLQWGELLRHESRAGSRRFATDEPDLPDLIARRCVHSSAPEKVQSVPILRRRRSPHRSGSAGDGVVASHASSLHQVRRDLEEHTPADGARRPTSLEERHGRGGEPEAHSIADLARHVAGGRPSSQEKKRMNFAPTATGDFTMVFTDVQGSTSLWEANPNAMKAALKVHDDVMRECMSSCHGYEVTTEGDAFQVAFNNPFDAVDFCLTVQVELKSQEWSPEILALDDARPSPDGAWAGLRVRMGVHSGQPDVKSQHDMTGRVKYGGQHVALAKAVEGACHGGQILVTSQCFSFVDGSLHNLECGAPQVIDLGEHILKCEGISNEHSEQKVRLLQLVPQQCAHDFFDDGPSTVTPRGNYGGRIFQKILSRKQTSLGFHESPSGQSVTLCFAFTAGARGLASEWPTLANEVLGMLRECVRSALRDSSDSGYECQEDEGAFMLAFANMSDTIRFAIELQRSLPFVPWSDQLKEISPEFKHGLQMHIGAYSGEYSSRGPHATTGRADYFGTIVNRTARVAAAAHPGQVLLGGDVGLPDVFELPQGTFLRRVGAYSLKGLEMPMPLHELQILDTHPEPFPEPRTQGRISD